jgi:hypothetical protein
MPFRDELNAVYEDHIGKVARKLNLQIRRADDFFTVSSIMQDIWNSICAARFVIGDCTGRNPNVFYEIGMAHTIGKPVILITQNSDDIPFDIRHIRYLNYSLTPRGMKTFEEELKRMIEELHVAERRR